VGSQSHLDDPLAARYRGAESRADGPPPPGAGQIHRDIVVIGASAGGVEALDRLVGGLPRELPAAIFVVLHLPATGRSVLPQILGRAGKLPASAPEDCERPERGHIYVAPPDRHSAAAWCWRRTPVTRSTPTCP
jgi:chemotaxis response regulator CheB